VVKTAAIFELQDVSFAHNVNMPTVLENFNLKIEEGSRTAILGANGAGKTTMFYTLTGVNKPQQGQVLYKGEPVEYTKEGLKYLRADAAVVLQNPDEQVFCSLVEEDVAFGPLNLDLPRDDVERRVRKALRDVRMTEYARRPIQQLSGGQRKRVAIAGALAMEPKVMIMDEPTAGLDPQASMEVMELAEKLHLQGVTVMISTHDVDLVYKWADISSVLCNKKVEFSGNIDEFYSDLERVHRCGQLSPALYNMNMDVSWMNGLDPAPFPHNRCEFIAKFGKNRASGRLICVPACEEDACQKYDDVTKDLPGVSVGVYGSDSRFALRGKDVEFKFDAMDECYTCAASGQDSILIYDSIYEETIKGQAEKLKGFGMDVDMEVVR